MSDSEFQYEDDDYNSFEYDSDYDNELSDNRSVESTELDAGDPKSNGATSRKPRSATYVSWTLDKFVQVHFLEKFDQLKASQLAHCTDDDLLIMLHCKRWQPEDVINDYFDDRTKLLHECGISAHPPPKNVMNTQNDFWCNICCETYETTVTYSLTCQHQFCINCYYRYVYNELTNGRPIDCMIPDCNLTIPHRDVEAILDEVEHDRSVIKIKKTLSENRLLRASAKAIIDSSSVYKWCPAPDCSHISELTGDAESDTARSYEEMVVSMRKAMIDDRSTDISAVPIVRCAGSHEFCFNCNYENHLPCPCWVVKSWIKKCQDDSETANWIEANTSSCPKCFSSIEKNGGCNHMTCQSCSHEFCWICLGNWSEHNNSYYKCNKFKVQDVEVEKKKNKSKLTLQRYLHFYRRFTIHESSMKGDLRVLKQLNSIAVMYLENIRKDESVKNVAWSDIQFLPEAMRALSNGRKTLKWTYCFAYYLADSNFQEIFENNQDYLNKTVEDLSEIFEKIITSSTKVESDIVKLIMKSKIKIINLSKTIELRQRTLIEGADDSLRRGLMTLEV